MPFLFKSRFLLRYFDSPGLFLDEAYALMDSAAGVGGAGDAFSQEALRRSRRQLPSVAKWAQHIVMAKNNQYSATGISITDGEQP